MAIIIHKLSMAKIFYEFKNALSDDIPSNFVNSFTLSRSALTDQELNSVIKPKQNSGEYTRLSSTAQSVPDTYRCS